VTEHQATHRQVAEAAPFDPELLLRELVDGGVDFVVVGGFAARLLGSPSFTIDLDVCYSRDETNLEALAAVLRDLHARLRGVDEEVPLRLDARALAAGDSFTFVTDAGPLDVIGTPSGTDGYEDLVRTAVTLDLAIGPVLVADIDSLIRMKRAAGRPKDRVEVEVLGALREEIDRGGGRGG
jgi:hypothetical protein